MTTEDAIDFLQNLHTMYSPGDAHDALTIALDALRAQIEPGPQQSYEGEIGILCKKLKDLDDAYAILDAEKCEQVDLRRDAEQRANTLERALRRALDALDAKEAGL